MPGMWLLTIGNVSLKPISDTYWFWKPNSSQNTPNKLESLQSQSSTCWGYVENRLSVCYSMSGVCSAGEVRAYMSLLLS
jgi:hypothetical protein